MQCSQQLAPNLTIRRCKASPLLLALPPCSSLEATACPKLRRKHYLYDVCLQNQSCASCCRTDSERRRMQISLGNNASQSQLFWAQELDSHLSVSPRYRDRSLFHTGFYLS